MEKLPICLMLGFSGWMGLGQHKGKDVWELKLKVLRAHPASGPRWADWAGLSLFLCKNRDGDAICLTHSLG